MFSTVLFTPGHLPGFSESAGGGSSRTGLMSSALTCSRAIKIIKCSFCVYERGHGTAMLTFPPRMASPFAFLPLHKMEAERFSEKPRMFFKKSSSGLFHFQSSFLVHKFLRTTVFLLTLWAEDVVKLFEESCPCPPQKKTPLLDNVLISGSSSCQTAFDLPRHPYLYPRHWAGCCQVQLIIKHDALNELP